MTLLFKVFKLDFFYPFHILNAISIFAISHPDKICKPYHKLLLCYFGKMMFTPNPIGELKCFVKPSCWLVIEIFTLKQVSFPSIIKDLLKKIFDTIKAREKHISVSQIYYWTNNCWNFLLQIKLSLGLVPNYTLYLAWSWW